MLDAREPRRVLVVAEPSPDLPLDRLFAAGPLSGWEAVPADGFAAARFVLQHNPCDLLLVDERLYRRDGPDAFDWLAGRHRLPAVILAGPGHEREAGARGAQVWLARGEAPPTPEALAAALDQAARLGELRRGPDCLAEELRQSRRQVDRLVGLLWRTLPLDADRRWLSQRHVLERLSEEAGRARRYGEPLTVAVGEVDTPGKSPADALPDWAAERVTRGKRGSDVAGQYGPHGFLLLLVHTPPAGGVACCRRLQRALEQPGPNGPARAYFGLAAAAGDATTPQALLRRAEEHLEAARGEGGEGLVADEGGPAAARQATTA